MRPSNGFDEWSQTRAEQCWFSTKVDDIQNDSLLRKKKNCISNIFVVNEADQNYLIEPDVVDGKIKPKSMSRIARIGTDVEIIFKVADVVDSSKIS